MRRRLLPLWAGTPGRAVGSALAGGLLGLGEDGAPQRVAVFAGRQVEGWIEAQRAVEGLAAGRRARGHAIAECLVLQGRQARRQRTVVDVARRQAPDRSVEIALVVQADAFAQAVFLLVVGDAVTIAVACAAGCFARRRRIALGRRRGAWRLGFRMRGRAWRLLVEDREFGAAAKEEGAGDGKGKEAESLGHEGGHAHFFIGARR